MTRKHFEALADALYSSRPICLDNSGKLLKKNLQAINQWKTDVLNIARVCAVENPRFDRDRFYTACGYEITELV